MGGSKIMRRDILDKCRLEEVLEWLVLVVSFIGFGVNKKISFYVYFFGISEFWLYL